MKVVVVRWERVVQHAYLLSHSLPLLGTELRNCHELTSTELDMVILGQLSAHDVSNTSTVHVSSSQSRTKHAAATYFYKNIQRCRKTFLFLHTLSDKRFQILLSHYEAKVVAPRRHDLTCKSPPNTTSLPRVNRMLDFAKNIAESISLPLPGCLPNFRDEQIQLLPTDMTKWMCIVNTARHQKTKTRNL